MNRNPHITFGLLCLLAVVLLCSLVSSAPGGAGGQGNLLNVRIVSPLEGGSVRIAPRQTYAYHLGFAYPGVSTEDRLAAEGANGYVYVGQFEGKPLFMK